MSFQEAITIGGEALPVIKLHATAAFSILNSFMRREANNSRVMGTLLGVIREGCVEIFDSFEVPFDERMEDMYVAIDQEYHKKMFDFHRRINKREQVVGWYSTTAPDGTFIVDTTSLFNDFYSKQCKRPIHVVMDTTLANGKLDIRGFLGKPLKLKEEQPFCNMFLELKVQMDFTEVETTCIYHMIHGQSNSSSESSSEEDTAAAEAGAVAPWSSSEVLSALPTEQHAVLGSMENLVSLLDNLQQYVDGVVDGSKPAFAEIGMSMCDVLANLNATSGEDVHRMYGDKMKDLLMVSYLSTLTQTQVQLSEKLNELL